MAASDGARDRAPAGSFGDYLRGCREAKGLTLEELSLQTKIPELSLGLVEASDLGRLPAEVFVRGFVRNHARATGGDADEAVRLLDAELAARREAARPRPTLPQQVMKDIEGAARGDVDGRRRLGVALVVLLILIVATLTVSLLWRRPAPVGGDLSAAPAQPRLDART